MLSDTQGFKASHATRPPRDQEDFKSTIVTKDIWGQGLRCEYLMPAEPDLSGRDTGPW